MASYTGTFKKLKEIALTRTARNSAWLLATNATTAAFSIVALILVSRALGPEKFGVVATFNAIWLTIVTLTDFGLGTSAIKFISSNLNKNARQVAIFMRVVIQLELICGVFIAFFGLLFSTQIADLLGGPHLLTAVRYGFIAGMFVSAGAFLYPFLISFGRFKTYFAINSFGAVFRVLGVVLLGSLAVLNLNNILILYTIVPALLFFLALIFTPKNFMEKSTFSEQKVAFKELFHFTKWIFLSTLAVVAYGKIDIFFLSSFHGSKEVGLYAAAIQLTNFFPLITGAIGGALLPRVSQMSTKAEYKTYLKKTTFGTVSLAILLVPIFFLSEPLVNMIFGSKFDGSIGTFKILFPSHLIALIYASWGLIFYSLNRPRTITFINYTQLIVTLIVLIWLIPPLGKNGAALALLSSQVVGIFMTGFILKRTLTKLS